MSKIPQWIQEWISKDRLVRSKFKISKTYLRHSKRIQLVEGKKGMKSTSKSFNVYSDKYGRYRVKYEDGQYHCNCPFFKHRLICSHILGVCQKINIWPDKETIFPKEIETNNKSRTLLPQREVRTRQQFKKEE